MEKQGGEGSDIKICRACGGRSNMKYGFRRGIQRYLCKECGFQFTTETERHSEIDERRAITLYCLGFSLRTIGRLLNYHHTTILVWIKEYAKQNCGQPKPKDEVLIGTEEMTRFIMSKKASAGYGQYTAALLGAYLSGKRKIEIPRLLKDAITD